MTRSAKRKKQSIPSEANPKALKHVDQTVRLRDSKGRFTKAITKAKTYEIPIKGGPTIKGSFPKGVRKSKERTRTVVDLIASHFIEKADSKQSLQRQVKTAKEILKKKKASPKDKEIAKQILDEAESRKKAEAEALQASLEAEKIRGLKKAEAKRLEKLSKEFKQDHFIEKLPPGVPDISSLRSVTRFDNDEIWVKGRRTGSADPEKREREGLSEYVGRIMKLKQMDVTLAEPVQMKFGRRREIADAMKRYFMQHAEKFFNDHKNSSENAFIMRVKVDEKIAGQPIFSQGVGTERTRFFNRDQLMEQMDDLFSYFLQKYEGYLSDNAMDSFAVTGFTMEVVQGSI